MTKKLPPPPMLSETRFYAMLLEQAVAINNEVLDAAETVGDDNFSDLTVTVGAEWLLDMTDALIQLSVVHEGFDPSEIDELVDLQRRYQSKYGNRTIH